MPSGIVPSGSFRPHAPLGQLAVRTQRERGEATAIRLANDERLAVGSNDGAVRKRERLRCGRHLPIRVHTNERGRLELKIPSWRLDVEAKVADVRAALARRPPCRWP